MMRATSWIGCVCVVFAVACGGAQHPTAAGGSSSRSSSEASSTADPRSLRALLSPIGERQPPDQLAAIARFIRRWERDPYADVPENDTGVSTPTAMLMWLTESPDVSVSICMFVSALAQDRGEESNPPMTMGSTFGMAAYLIEHPGIAPTSAEVQVAGMESGLRWYQASMRRGAARSPLLDELVQRAAQPGGLRAWYDEHQVRCGD